MQYKIQYDNNGNPQEVIIEEDIFKGHEDENPRNVIRDYLKENIGASAKIIESGQRVYLGEDLPGEYSYSEKSRQMSNKKFKAKGQATQNLLEMVEIAENRSWKKNEKDKHNVDAKYGWYKYTTHFNAGGKSYSADLLIRNDANGKKYLYDVINIKNGAPLKASNHNGSAMANVSSYTNNTTGAEESQGEFAYKDADVPNTPLADALGNIDINSIYKNGRNDAGDDFRNKVITPVSPSVNQGLTPPSSEGGSGQIELKGRGEFDSDEAYAHYLIDVGQKELAKVPKITRAFLEAIARRTGLKIVIGDTGAITGQKSAGGYSRSRDMLVLDYDTISSPDKLARAVINHELVHATETSMFYKSLEKHAFEQMFEGDEKALNDAIKKKQERYARSGVKLGRDGAKAELVARYIGESVLTSEAAINRLVIEKPTLAMQIKNALVKTYDKAKTYFTDKEAYEARYVMSDLEKGIKLFEKALDTRRNFKDFAQRLSGNTGGDVQRMSAGEGEEKYYTYNALIKKPDMIVSSVDEQIPLKPDGGVDKAMVLKYAMKNVKEKNNPKNTEDKLYVHVKDLGKDVMIGSGGLRHGLRRNSENIAVVSMHIGDILENSIKVNQLGQRKDSKSGDVLLGVGEDSDGNRYFTRMIVNNYELNDVEVLSVLYAVNAKKKNQSPSGARVANNSASFIKGPSKISIADLLYDVKTYFADILPTDVLNTYGEKRPPSVLSDSVQFSSPVAAETQQEFGEITTRRAYDYFKKNRNAYKKEIGRMFGVPGKDLSVLDADIDAYAKEYFENGAVSAETKNRLFEDAWKNGIVVDDTNAQLGKEIRAQLGKEIRAQLKKQTLYIDPNSARDIPDFGKFRLSQMGNMTLSMQRGYSVDAMYQELSESYGNLFPADITASSDRLLKISEVMAGLTEERYSLDTLYGAEQKADYKQEFLKNTAGFEKVLGDVVRYEADKTPGKGNAEGKVNKDIVKEQKLIEQSIAKVTARSQGGSRLYERVYEDNVNVKVTDACFMKLSHKYKVERDELKNKILELNQQLAKISEVRDGKEHFLSCVRNFVEMNEVTPMILQELIEKIEVHAVEGTGLNCTQSVVIHYKFIGELDMPENFDKIKVNTRKGVEVEYLRTTKMA